MSDNEVPVITLIVAGDDRKALARGVDADAVLFDLADVDTADKAGARGDVTDALGATVWSDVRRLVRVNGWATRWTYRDVIEVVEGAGEHLGAIVLPGVRSAHDVVALDLLLTQIETTMELGAGCVRIVAQLDDARGVQAAPTLAGASDRLYGIGTTLPVFAPAVVLAARAAELPAFCSAADAARVDRARDDGFDGVCVDDPALVAGARAAFDG